MIDKINFGEKYNIPESGRQQIKQLETNARELLGNSYDDFIKIIKKNHPRYKTKNYTMEDRMQSLYDYYIHELDFYSNEKNMTEFCENNYERELNKKKQELKKLKKEIAYMKKYRNELIAKSIAEKSIAYITKIINDLKNWMKL